MSAERITALLDEAAEHYNQGQYEQAVGLWREALTLDPSVQKAREGIRMAKLLLAEHQGSQGPQPAAGTVGGEAMPEEPADKIAAGMIRVRELMAAGELEQALEGCTILSELAPDNHDVRALAEEIGRTAGFSSTIPPTGDVEALLLEARAALEAGRNREAAAAASKVVQIDPSNMEACGILSLAADDDDAIVPLEIDIGETGPTATVVHPEQLSPVPLEDPVAISPAAAPQGEERIEQLIAEGQAAFDAGKPQEAVEIWSRVFALDQTNARATHLMDQAKAAIEAQTRAIDELFFRAVDAYDGDRLEEALGQFQHLLSISPFHAEASSYVDQINARLSGEGQTIKLDTAAAQEPAVPPAPVPSAEDLFEGGSVPLAFDREVAAPAAPERSEATARPARPVPRRLPAGDQPGGFKRVLLAGVGAVLFVSVAVGAYLWFGTDTPSMPEAEATTPAPPPMPRPAPPSVAANPATTTGSASPLKVLPGARPQEPVPAPELPKVEDLKEQAAVLEREGLREYAAQHWAEAVLALRKAAELDPLDFHSSAQLDEAMTRLERQARLEEETGLVTRYFKEQDYASALHKLYRLQLDYPEIKQFDRYIRISWYNWGVILLQAGAVDEAEEKFGEALAVAPTDRDALRGREIAQRYHGRTRDAAFDAFAASLAHKPLDPR